MEIMELFQRLGLALALGFLVGVERGWKQREEEDGTRAAGMRTYMVIGQLGGVSALIGSHGAPMVFAALALVFGLLWAVYKLWETWTDGDISVTGAMAGVLVYALGAYAVLGSMPVAAAAGVALVLILAFKDAAHTWLERLTWVELRSALAILAATFIALPVLPNTPIDPYGAIVPAEIWRLTVVIASVSFLGYVCLKTLGSSAGLYLGTAAGALVSSTAMTLDLARRAKREEVDALQAACASALASAVSLTRVGVFIGVFASAAASRAWPALGAAIGVCAVAAAFGLWRGRKSEPGEVAHLSSPFDLKSVVSFALFLAFVMAATRLAVHFFGDAGVFPLAVIAGLVDVDSVALAIGGAAREHLTAHAAGQAILLAALVNTLFKSGMAAVAGGARFATIYAGISLVALAAGAAVYFSGADFNVLLRYVPRA